MSGWEGFGGRFTEAYFLAAASRKGKIGQDEVGRLVGEKLGDEPITAATVSRWGSGKQEPDLRTIEAIADVLDCDPGWLAFGEKSSARGPRSHAGERAVPLHRSGQPEQAESGDA